MCRMERKVYKKEVFMRQKIKTTEKNYQNKENATASCKNKVSKLLAIPFGLLL